MTRITQYQRLAEPLPSFANRVFADSWQQPPNLPPKLLANRALPYATVLASTTLSWTPTPPTAERTSPDRYYTEIQRVLTRDQARWAQVLADDTDYAASPFPVTPVVTTSADRWQPRTEIPFWPKKPLSLGWFAKPDQQSLPDLDSWVPATVGPTFAIKRAQAIYQVFGVPERQQIPDTDSWIYETYRPPPDIARRQALYPSLAFAESIFAETITSDKWHVLDNLPRWDTKRQQWALDWSSLGPQPLPTPVFLDRWWQNPNQPLFDLKRQQWIQPGAFTQSVFKEAVSIDRFGPLPNQPLFSLLRSQYAGPVSVSNVLPIPAPLFWFPQPNLPVFDVLRRQVQAQFLAFTEKQFVESTSVDRYVPLPNLPVFDRRRQQATNTFAVLNPFPLPNTQPFADKWAPLIVQPNFDRKRSQWAFPSAFFSQIAFRETISADKWWQAPNVPLFDLRRQQFNTPTSVANLLPIPPISSTFWIPAIEQPLFDLRRQQTAQTQQAWAIVPPPPLISTWPQPVDPLPRPPVNIGLFQNLEYERWDLPNPPPPPPPPARIFDVPIIPGLPPGGSVGLILLAKPYGAAGYGDDGYGFWVFPYQYVYPTIHDILDQRITPQEYTTASTMFFTGYGDQAYGSGGYGVIIVPPTISGVIDGVNPLFTIQGWVRRIKVFLNGILQTQNYDVKIRTGGAIIFLKNVPQPGDIVTAEVWLL